MTTRKASKGELPDGEIYGFLLILRGLARAAIQLKNHPSALRVLCVAADYMNKDGTCRVGQDALAARLEMTRQAVNKHLALLDTEDILLSTSPLEKGGKHGVLKNYYLNTDGLEEIDARAGQDRVDERRKAKREAKRAAGAQGPPKPNAKAAPIEPEITAEDAAPTELFRVGQAVEGLGFGYGVVQSIDGDRYNVKFEGSSTVRTCSAHTLRSEPEPEF